MGSLAQTDEYDPFAAEKFVPQPLQDWTEQAAPKDLALISGIAKHLWNTPEEFAHSIERYRAGGDFEPGPALDAAMLGTAGPMLGGTGTEAGTVLTAGMRRRPLPPRPVWDESISPPAIGHNMPPPEMQMVPEAPPPAMGAVLAPEAPPPMGSLAAEPPPQTWAQGLPRPRPAAKSTDIPSIRDLPAADAIDIARTQPHLIQAGDRSQGYYVGGPPDVASKRGLTNRRQRFDDYVAADPRGGPWYDRYRSGVSEVTGGDRAQADWMAAQEGQFSAGVDPGSEVHFSLKENNANIAGMPVKAARPAQHEALTRAIEQKDWRLMQLGDKTGEYARLVNPFQTQAPGATGVNDFRHGENWGFPREAGTAFTTAQHKFLDFETALAVDRANRTNLGGRSNWTGEQLQAAPWVRQKALDIQERGGKNEDGSHKLSYEEAFDRANKTIVDFFPRHTAFATHEFQPGSTTGHMMGSLAANPAERAAYAADAGSSWATAPGGRDAIYSGLGVEGTGNYMRVRPSQDMTGYYQPPDAPMETNPGQVARPLVTFNTATSKGEPFKTITPHDRVLLDAGEAVRGYLDAQNASAWHKNWVGGPANQSNSLFFPRSGPVPPAELAQIEAVGGKYGLSNVVDTGQGVTSTRFGPELSAEESKALTKAVRKGEFTSFGEPQRVRTDSGYIDYTDKWPAGVGSGQATTHMLEYLNKTPELRDAFNRNPYIGERAAAKLARDDTWASKWGAPREDIQNARRIISSGPGWVDRLEEALKAGAILPAVAAAIYAGAMADRGGSDDRS